MWSFVKGSIPLGGRKPVAHVKKAFPVKISAVARESRSSLVALVALCFSGMYRWHATRILRSVKWVRRADQEGTLAGLSMFTLLQDRIGYVYYLAVEPSRRRAGIAGLLLDDALEALRRQGAAEVLACVRADNAPSLKLFLSRRFVTTGFRELVRRHGAMQAAFLWLRMVVAPGEKVLWRTP